MNRLSKIAMEFQNSDEIRMEKKYSTKLLVSIALGVGKKPNLEPFFYGAISLFTNGFLYLFDAIRM